MNPLQEYPHLFTGNFKAKVDDPDLGELIIPIAGAMVLSNGWWLIPDYEDSFHVDHCTLIARPISDMVDEEIKKHDSIKKKLLSLNNGTYMGETMLYLLSIGIYPFNQSHFENGTVIDSREV